MLPCVAAQERRIFSRRALLTTGIAGACAAAMPRFAHGATAFVLPAVTGDRRFTVIYKNNKIGAHTISYSSTTGETQVSTKIDLLVKVAFFTLFRFKHRSEETWRGGRLISLDSETLEHGETLRIKGAAVPQGFRVTSEGGPFIAGAGTLTSNSLWTPAVLEQATVVDAQHGGIIGVSGRKVADEKITIAGRLVDTARYSLITPYLAGSIWYDADNLWVRGEFERDGSKIQYRLDA